MGSAVLGCAATLLVKMGGGADRGKTGDSGELAFSRISALPGASFLADARVGQQLLPTFVGLSVAWPAKIPSGEGPGFMANY